MPWKDVNLEQWAASTGVDLWEIDQKLKLRNQIIRLRQQLELSQDELAEQVGVSRSRIAQIESGVKIHKMSFDILLRILQALGCEYRITARRAA